MNDQKKISPMCLAGCILSSLSVISLAGCAFTFLDGTARLFGGYHNRLVFMNVMLMLAMMLMIAGLITSIRGIVTADSRGYKGKALGVIGIVLAVLVIIIYLAGVGLMLYEDRHRESPPTNVYGQYD